MKKAFIWLLLCTMTAAAAAGAEEWRIGVALPLSGRESSAASAALAGLRAGAKRANDEPGNVKITLVEMDTEGRMVSAALAADQMVSEQRVAALVHAGDHESALALAAVAVNTRTPLVGAGHAVQLVENPNLAVFATRAPLYDELDNVLSPLAASNKVVTVFAPARGLDAAETARAFAGARRAGLPPASRLVSLPADDVVALRRLIAQASKSDAQIFVLPVADCVPALLAAPPSGLRIVASTSWPEPVIQALGARSEGIIFSLPLPLYTQDRLPLARSYRAAMGTQPLGYASYTAFWSMRVLVEGIRRSAGRPSGIVPGLESIDAEVDGMRVQYGLGKRQGLYQTWLGQVRGSQLVPIEALP